MNESGNERAAWPAPVRFLILLGAGGVTGAFGFMALLGWMLGIPRLASLGERLVPMAPSTAVLFLLFGLAICLQARPVPGRRAFWLSAAISGLSALLGLGLLVQSLGDIRWAGERFVLAIPDRLAGLPIGRMSPATALLFLLASLSFMLSLAPSGTRSWRAVCASGTAILLLGTSFVFLLGHGFNTPLLSGGSIVPPALSTIVAFTALGLAVLIQASRPGSRRSHEPANLSFLLTTWLLLGSGVVAAGYVYYRSFEQEVRREAESRLMAVAELKASELARWYRERSSEGGIFFENPAFSSWVRRLLNDPGDTLARKQVQVWISKIHANGHYGNSRLLNTAGRTLLSVPEGLAPPSAETVQAAAEILRSGQPILRDFSRPEPNRPNHLAVMVPIYDDQDAGLPLGVLMLRIDPNRFLFPFLQRWPIPSKSAETLLMRRGRSNALFLNALRFQSVPALTSTTPQRAIELPTDPAASDKTGVIEGLDYRGVQVLAAVCPVADSPWKVVSKIDTAEAYAPLRERMWGTILFVGVLLFGAGAGVNLVWRRQRVRFYQDRFEAAEALRESESRFRELIINQSEGVGLVDAEERFTFSNPASDEIFGVAPGSMVGRTLMEFVSPDQHALIREQTKACSAGKKSVYELQINRPDGESRWLQVSAVPRTDKSGRFVSTFGVFLDITKMKQAAQSLRESEAKYRSIFENALAGIFQSGLDGRYRSVNRSMARMLGYDSVEEMMTVVTNVGMQVYADPNARERMLQRLAQNGQVDNVETQFCRKDGQKIWVLVNAHSVADATGRLLYLEGSCLDITEHKRFADLEMEKARAEAANRAKSVFLAHMSHEIRTPMNAILGFAQLMGRDPALSKTQREHLRIIDRNGEHLLTLINDILDMSKIEARQVTLQLAPFDLSALARDLQSMFAAEAAAKGLQFAAEVASAVPERVLGDEGKLRQILVNLLGNAIKYTARGKVGLRLRADGPQENRWRVWVEVEDSGPGIDSAEIDRLFRPFEQTATGQKSGTGSGLGLAISREFARLMGGDVTLESEVGRGSIFRVEVFLEQAEAGNRPETRVAVPPGARLAPDGRGCRVLVVDDFEVNRRLLLEMLAPTGCTVREASDGNEAVALFDTWQPHLILMDLRMPGMDGCETIRLIRAHRHGRQVKILCHSASAFSEDRDQALAAGTDDFLGKPFREEVLWDELAKLLDLRIESPPGASVGAAASVAPVAGPPPPLPEELSQALRQAVLELDIDRITALIERVRQHDPVYAGKLNALAMQFDYHRLETLLSKPAQGCSA